MTAYTPDTEVMRLTLHAECAADVMRPDPVSLRADASLPEALELFTERSLDAAPVIDDAGHPIGVLSRSDILIHERELVRSDSCSARAFVETRVQDLMTPAVFSTRPHTPVAQVIREMQSLRVHRLFVVDEGNVLIGVINAMDILGCLRP